MKKLSNLGLHPKCMGCEKIKWEQICKIYLEPAMQWTRLGGCAGRTHDLPTFQGIGSKPGFIDPLKASKQKAKKR